MHYFSFTVFLFSAPKFTNDFLIYSFPENGNLYHFDVPYHEVDIITAEERQPKTQSIQDVMKGVVVYVEIRSSEDDRSSGVKEVISKLGAKVNDRLLRLYFIRCFCDNSMINNLISSLLYRNTTHVIFKDGLMSTYKKAKNWNIPIVSLHWIEACKKHLCLMDPSEFNIQDFHRYENPELYDKAKVLKNTNIFRHFSKNHVFHCELSILACEISSTWC